MYKNLFNIFLFVFIGIFLICFFLLIFKIFLHIIALFPNKKYPLAKKNHKFAIIIPARYESNVIKNILTSIKTQDYPSDLLDTYVIVESLSDPTCEIIKDYTNTYLVIRQELEKKGKGYALEEGFNFILANNFNYDAFFIFDADNVLDTNYMKEMNNLYDLGYDIGIGYRNTSNWNYNWVSACSGLMFSIFNHFNNKPRNKLKLNILVCGTGFYVSSKIISKLGGWKFFSLTEDYEFNLYSILNNIKSGYNYNAIFYDEQPVSLKQSILQRIRWCKGYKQSNKIYFKKLLKAYKDSTKKQKINIIINAFGAFPIAFTLGSIILFQLINFIFILLGIITKQYFWYIPLIYLLSAFLFVYAFLMLYTLFILILDKKRSNINIKTALNCIVLNPFFMLLYLPIYIYNIFKKNIQWSIIKHGN